jgi:lipopolysaccharide transport system ATP-binding protein
VEKFIDTPLKHYSSGMQLRLAFAVAAFLEAEILVVDEVLSVGDAEFQKKCLGKMEDVTKKEGRTVLFVSHNMTVISQLCNRSILLDCGNLICIDKTQEVIRKYLNDSLYNSTFKKWDWSNKNGVVRPISISVTNAKGERQFKFKNTEEVHIIIEYELLTDDINEIPYPNIHLINSQNQYVLLTIMDESFLPTEKKIHKIKVIVCPNLLNSDIYYIWLAFTNLKNHRVEFSDKYCVSFEVIDSPENRNYPWRGPLVGVLRMELKWEVIKN